MGSRKTAPLRHNHERDVMAAGQLLAEQRYVMDPLQRFLTLLKIQCNITASIVVKPVDS